MYKIRGYLLNFFSKMDEEILAFIGEFGRTYSYVLGKTFFSNEKQAIGRIHKMKVKGLIERVPTGLNKPRNAILLTKMAKDYLLANDAKIKKNKGSISHLNHNIMEQIAFYHLSKIGDTIRASTWHHMNVYFAVPDLVVRFDNFNIAIEVEATQKSKSRYEEYVKKAKLDVERSDRLHRFLFVTKNKAFAETIANAMPIWDRLFFIDIDTLIDNIKTYKKITPFSQKQLLKKIEKIEEQTVYEERKKEEKISLEEKLKKDLKEKNEAYEKLKKESEELKVKLRLEQNSKKHQIKNLEEELKKYRNYFKKKKEEKNKSVFARIFKK